MKIHAELSHAALTDHVMPSLHLGLLDSAWAVHVVATSNMMRAVKAVSTYRGRDPTDFVLMAFGGNGGIFAAELARQLQIGRVLVPPGAGVFSAIGLTMADKEFGRTRAFMGRVDAMDTNAFNRTLRDLEKDVVETLGAAATEQVKVRRSASMRYAGQAFELQVRLPDHDLSRDDLPALADAFEAEHEHSYGHRLTDAAGVDIVALEVVAGTSPWQGRTPVPLPPAGAAPTITERSAYFGPELGSRSAAVLPRRTMLTQRTPGPLIVEEYEGTTVVPPGAVAWLDEHANIVIAFAE
jgi:N-methylhydantoinase A